VLTNPWLYLLLPLSEGRNARNTRSAIASLSVGGIHWQKQFGGNSYSASGITAGAILLGIGRAIGLLSW
jgi:hypothetical protein